jgi:ketosteroid isomerase-like protein
MMRNAIVACCFMTLPFGATAQDKQVTNDQYEDLQRNFEQAYNRKDAGAMADAFTEDAVRITPSGIFQGREAIRRNLEDVLNNGLKDYTVRRTVSRSEGVFVFNAGEWTAKLGDQSLRGYYSAIIIRDGDRAKIMEETVSVAAP